LIINRLLFLFEFGISEIDLIFTSVDE